MIFYKQHRGEVRTVTGEDIPSRYLHLLIPHARAYITEGIFGTILSQEVREKDFIVWQHHFFIRQSCTLLAYNNTSMLTINYMLQGSPFTKINGLKETPLEEGMYRLFFVPEIVQPVSFSIGNYCCAYICFDPVMLKKKAARHQRLSLLIDYAVQDADKILAYLPGKIDEDTYALLMDLLWYQDTSDHRAGYVQLIAWKLLRRYALRHHAMNDDVAILEKYILENLHLSIKIKHLERYCGKSRTALFRIFRLQFGKSPAQYIQFIRIEEAKKLLVITDMTITQIADQVGFLNITSFNRIFKKHTGISPSQYRQAFK